MENVKLLLRGKIVITVLVTKENDFGLWGKDENNMTRRFNKEEIRILERFGKGYKYTY